MAAYCEYKYYWESDILTTEYLHFPSYKFNTIIISGQKEDRFSFYEENHTKQKALA